MKRRKVANKSHTVVDSDPRAAFKPLRFHKWTANRTFGRVFSNRNSQLRGVYVMYTHALASISLFALVVQNTTLVILLKISFRKDAEPYAPTTVVFVVEFMKLAVCSTVVCFRSVKDLQTSVIQIWGQWMLFLPALLYVIQNNLLFFGAQRLSPILYVVCTQTKILSSAIMSRVVLGTRHSYAQYSALLLLIVGIVVVQEQSISDGSSPPQEHGIDKSSYGIAAVLLASLTSGTAGVILEKIHKTTARQGIPRFEHTVWTRNVQLSIISIPFAGVGIYFADDATIQGGHFFRGYDLVVFGVVFVQATGGIIVALVLKFANNMMKCMAISVSICCCAFYSVSTGELSVTPPFILGVLLVNIAVSIYSLNPVKHKMIEGILDTQKRSGELPIRS